MKSVILNVRVPQEIKATLIIDGNQKGKNLSDNTRDILTDHCHKFENRDSILGSEMYNSNEFIFLFAWIMEKRRCQINVDDIEVLNNLKKVTYKVINDESLPDSIREEFEKVHFDLKRYIKNYKTPNNSFDFCEQNGSSFDYSHLIEYATDRAFENKTFL